MTLAALRELPLLAGVSDSDLALLADHCRWAWHQPGETIVRQGEAQMEFCIVVRGQAEVQLAGDLPTRLALLGPGDFFGELSVLTGGPAPASVVAREMVSLLCVTAEGLNQLLKSSDHLARQLVSALSLRANEAGLRLHRTRLRERTLSDHIARQGARTYPEWVGTGAWSQRVRAAIVRGSRSDEPVVFVGETGTGKELAAARMHYNSGRKEGPFIVMDGPAFTEAGWAEAVRLAAHGTLLVRRADEAPVQAADAVAAVLPAVAGSGRGRIPSRVPRIMATAREVDDRDPSPLEEAILAEGYAVPIPAVRDRLEDLPALVRHFVRKYTHGAAADGQAPISGEAMRRLASFPFAQANVRELERTIQEAALLAGGGMIGVEHLRLNRARGAHAQPRVGLVLGGGVVRGTAHIGVIRAFAEEGIPIDCVVGTSSGSLIGAFYAGGLDWREMQELARNLSWLQIAEPAWPRGGFVTNRRLRRFLDAHIGPVSFADLKIPFAAVAADANTGQELVIREGRVADAVRGSTAIPGLFRPVEFEGRLLVDGVVVNNVPANAARAMGADLVIAVDVTEYGFSAGAPRSVAEAVMRAFDIMARQTITTSLEWADVVIRPQVSGLNSFSPRSAVEYMRRGYSAARELVPEIRLRLEELRREMRI
ncbi:MAG TPA: patatin-like phospholipase family protein [Symbiobacteriaceae bacterium]|nr:patatin-like phospholipase family protein [Symbiobacteriaceae bacterium]